jgi:hypothetical protein
MRIGDGYFAQLKQWHALQCKTLNTALLNSPAKYRDLLLNCVDQKGIRERFDQHKSPAGLERKQCYAGELSWFSVENLVRSF